MPLPNPIESNVKSPPTKGDPRLGEHMRLLQHSPGWSKLHAAIHAEITRCSEELETTTDHARMLRAQGRITALRWVLNLPAQLHKHAGGEAHLEEPESPYMQL